MHQLPFDQGAQIVIPPRSPASVSERHLTEFFIDPNDLALLFIMSMAQFRTSNESHQGGLSWQRCQSQISLATDRQCATETSILVQVQYRNQKPKWPIFRPILQTDTVTNRLVSSARSLKSLSSMISNLDKCFYCKE